jgi:ADP-ribose pyrophosphatase YjhB (NUDIX family)
VVAQLRPGGRQPVAGGAANQDAQRAHQVDSGTREDVQVPGAIPTYPVSVKGVVIRDGQVLLLRNDRDEWELPGGRLERDETPQQCVAREIDEEVGWSVRPDRLLDVWVYRIEQVQREVLVVTYGCRVNRCCTEAGPAVSKEHLEARLFPLEQVPLLPLPLGYQQSIATWQRLLDPAGDGLTRPVARP